MKRKKLADCVGDLAVWLGIADVSPGTLHEDKHITP